MSEVLGDVYVEIGGDASPLDAALARTQTKVGQFAKDTTDVNFRRISGGFRSLAAAAGMKESPMMQAAQGIAYLLQGIAPKAAYLGALFVGWSAGTFLDQTFKISDNLSAMITKSGVFKNIIDWWGKTGNALTPEEIAGYKGKRDTARTTRNIEEEERIRKSIREGIKPHDPAMNKKELENWAAEQVTKIRDLKKAMYWEEESKKERDREKKTLGGSTAQDINKAIQDIQGKNIESVADRKQLEETQKQTKELKLMNDKLDKAGFAGFI